MGAEVAELPDRSVSLTRAWLHPLRLSAAVPCGISTCAVRPDRTGLWHTAGTTPFHQPGIPPGPLTIPPVRSPESFPEGQQPPPLLASSFSAPRAGYESICHPFSDASPKRLSPPDASAKRR